MKKTKRVMSPEARKRISDGMKARYAKLRKVVDNHEAKPQPDRTFAYLCAEFGYIAHEKGKSIERTMIDLQALLEGK